MQIDNLIIEPGDEALLPRKINATALIGADLPARQLILDPILSTKALALLYGPRRLGKTFVALGIAWAAASGSSFLKWRATRPHRVLYLDGEMPAEEMKQRLSLLGSAPPTLDFMLADLLPRGLPDLGIHKSQEVLQHCWGKRPELLVLDNLASLIGIRTNDTDSWGTLQPWLINLRRNGTAVLLVHHANKEGEQRGTSRREDVLDLVMSLRRPSDYEPKDGARFELHFEKARGLFGEITDPIEARLVTDEVGVARWDWRPAQVGELDRAAALLRDGLNPSQVAAELGISKAKGYRLRQKAAEMGLVA